jgi:hypothetical protein
MGVVLKESDPYIYLFEKDGVFVLSIFDGEVSDDIPLKGDPKTVFSQIAPFVGDI